MGKSKTEQPKFGRIEVMLLVLAPFYINDFFLIEAKTADMWLWVDYASRILALALLFLVAADWRQALRENGIGNLPKSALAFVAATAIGLGVTSLLEPWIDARFPFAALQAFPGYDNDRQRMLDLTLGIALVALSEEVIFRWYLDKALSGLIGSKSISLIVGAAFFGLIHWSQSLAGIAGAFVIGLAFGAIYRQSGSIWPLVIAHYVIDVVEYSGQGPG